MTSTTESRYRVSGMDCAGCAAKIDRAVRRIEGVSDVSVSPTVGTMVVRHAGPLDAAVLERKVKSLGYGLTPAPRGSAEPSRAEEGETVAHAHGPHDGHDHAHDHDHDHDHDHEHATSSQKTPVVAGLHGHDHSIGEGPWWGSRKGRLTLGAGAALLLAYGLGQLFPETASVFFLAALLVGLGPVALRAFAAARAGTPFSIEMLMTIAAVGAVVIDAGEEAATVVLLFLVGELLEGVAAQRARRGIEALSALVPKTALLETDGATRSVPAETLQAGDRVLVRPGDRLPADGEIVSGESQIDEASMTGESVPVFKGVGAAVFAGTVNGDGTLKVRVTATAADNMIARIVRLVEEAQEAKAPTQRFIDRFSNVYTPLVVLVALLTAVLPPLLMGGDWGGWFYKGLAILLIGCPCALVISVPAAIASALSAGARRGMLVKGGTVLETLAKVEVIAFDKTGTLTAGRPVVTDILSFGAPEAEILRLAAALETGSSHPLAAAILTRANDAGIVPPAVEGGAALGGKGVSGNVEGRSLLLASPKTISAEMPLGGEIEAQIAVLNEAGKTVSILAVDGRPVGALAMRDDPRPDARTALAALKQRGVETLMLTGDNARVAAAVGADLGIAVRADLLPADKQRIVLDLKAQGRRVAKVGDGINDAPALAAADVGIAIGGGADVALETADAALLQARVGDVPALIDLSRRAMANIRQNIAVALGLKAVFLVTTLVGLTGLWPAILADTGATVLVTMNALRLLKS
ncbi:heavy metal translocating P-type ATPase [Rhizobium sp. YIM 134829]|uniref:heavy metal translocating P-type ATPase n=1 Tax=Rhizobium sp. YIM 134829 TaxID=3390453 RepID=UPI00397C75CD